MSRRVTKAEENVIAIKTLVNKWREKPLFARIDDGKAETLLNIKGKTDFMQLTNLNNLYVRVKLTCLYCGLRLI